MTKYEEILKSYKTAMKRYADYRKECWRFAHKLVNGLINYLKCPKELVMFDPLNREIKEGQIFTLEGAMHLEDDTFWHLGIGINLYREPNIIQERVKLCIMIKGSNKHFIVKLEGINKEFEIDENKPEEFKTFYDFIFKQITEFYDKGLIQFLEKDKDITTLRNIGFKIN